MQLIIVKVLEHLNISLLFILSDTPHHCLKFIFKLLYLMRVSSQYNKECYFVLIFKWRKLFEVIKYIKVDSH